MPPAPTVDDLNTLINQYQTALAPSKAAIDTQIQSNDQSGEQQTAGLDAAKTTAFNGITQSANDRGGYFSGFTPDAQAKYTSATYLPALAALQSTIAGTRSTLLGKEADLNTQANQSALTTQQTQKSDLEKYNEAQAAAAAAAAAAEKQNEFTAGQNALDRAATLSASQAKASSAAPTAAQLQTSANQDIATLFNGYNPKDKNSQFYTEKTVLPKLTQLYPELSPAAVSKLVYSYRKNTFGE